MEYPSELLAKIDNESQSVARSLAVDSPANSAPLVKALAERKLLAMTPKAIDILDDGMNGGLVKDRVAAASRVLDLSPATRQQSAFGGEQSIPVEALKSIFDGMAKMFQSLPITQNLPVADAAPLHDIDSVTVEVLDEAPADPAPVPGRSRAAATRRPSLRRVDAVHGDGISTQEEVEKKDHKVARRPKQHQAKHKPRG